MNILGLISQLIGIKTLRLTQSTPVLSVDWDLDQPHLVEIPRQKLRDFGYDRWKKTQSTKK